jgi:hypothetical protein
MPIYQVGKLMGIGDKKLWHMIELINEAVNAVRRSEVKITPALRDARFSVLQNEENLTAQQRKKRGYGKEF